MEIAVLENAKVLDLLKAHRDRFIPGCLAEAMDIPRCPKASRMPARDGYQLTLLFDHGEERTIDFRKFLDPNRRYDQILPDDIAQFNLVQVEADTLVWRELGYWTDGIDGEREFGDFDVDRDLLLEAVEVVLGREV